MSDRASKALAEASLPGEPRTYDVLLACCSHVALIVLSLQDIGTQN
jgi:hypothetical protein